MRVRHREPVEWRQLCAIVRDVLAVDPAIDDTEWKERVKDRVLSIGFTHPREPDAITRALRAVEAALAKEGHPRPTVQVDAPGLLSPARESRPLTHEEAVRAITQFNAHGLLKPMPAVPPPVSQHTADRTIAARMVAQEIVASVERCEALERAAAASEDGATTKRYEPPAEMPDDITDVEPAIEDQPS